MSSEHIAVIAGAGGGGLLFLLLSCAVLFSSYNRKPNKARIAHDSHDTVAPGHTPNSDTPQNVPSNESIEVLDAFVPILTWPSANRREKIPSANSSVSADTIFSRYTYSDNLLPDDPYGDNNVYEFESCRL